MIPNMTKDWFIWNRNYSNIGLVTIDRTKGRTLLEAGHVEDGVWRATFD